MLRASSSAAAAATTAHTMLDLPARQLITAQELQPRLLPFVLQGGTEFDDLASYQSKALERLALHPLLDTSVATPLEDAKLVQYYVLYCILEATNGQPNVMTSADYRFDIFDETNFPEWTTTDGWLNVGSDPCGTTVETFSSTSNTTTAEVVEFPWYGITCDEQGRVTDISLVNNLMTGYFPPEVKLLAGDGPFASSGAGNLNYLELYDNEFLFNNFDNTWMADLGTNLGKYSMHVVNVCVCVLDIVSSHSLTHLFSAIPLSFLEYLFVGSTGFAGLFPPLPVGVLEADFGYTLIHKGFDDPAVFADCQLLEYLNLGGNALNTTLPTTLTALPQLQYLYVHDCMLQGNLDYLTSMPAILEHWIDGNPQFTGGIPEGINATSATLASLSLTANGLTGSLPTTLGLLTNLQFLWLYDNALTGSLPSELGALASLKTLQVEGNPLNGIMPLEVCDNTGMFGRLSWVGVDCEDTANGGDVECTCCSCCSLHDCQPDVYPETAAPTMAPSPQKFELNLSDFTISLPTP
jgi:hypothetical protein